MKHQLKQCQYHCITVLLDQRAMRSVLNLQIDINNTTKSRFALKFSYQTKTPYNPPFT